MSDGAKLILQGIQPAIQAANPVANFLGGLGQAGQLQRMALQNELLGTQLGMAPLREKMMQEQLLSMQQQREDVAPVQLEAMRQQNQLRGQQIKQLESQAESRMFGDIVGIVQRSSLISDEGKPNYIREQAARLDIPGVQDLSDEIKGMSDDELLSYLPKVMGLGKQLGLMKSKPEFTAVEVDADNGMVVYTNTETGNTKTVPLNEFSLGDMTPKDRREFQKETRTNIRGEVGKIIKEARTLSQSRDKINSLIGEARKGNRSATAAIIMNLARLNSPGVVTDADFANISGAQNPISAAISLLQGKGVDMQAVMRGIDPTNPENFDPNSVIATANSLITSQTPTLISSIDGLRKKADIAELPQVQKDTIFADVDFVSGIQPISGGSPAAAPDVELLIDDLVKKYAN